MPKTRTVHYMEVRPNGLRLAKSVMPEERAKFNDVFINSLKDRKKK